MIGIEKKIDIRDLRSEDLNFVRATWINTYRHSPIGRLMRSEIYHREQAYLIDRLLAHSEVAIACWAKDNNLVYGYVVYEEAWEACPLVIHFAYVKSSYRDIGIFSKLLRSTGYEAGDKVILTHPTKSSKKIAINNENLIQNPFFAWKRL